MSHRSLLGIAALVVLLAPTPAAAQSSNASPFRPQQWGVEFGLGSNFASLGLLRFQTAERALLFDVQGSVTRVSPDSADALTNVGGMVRLGMRRYRSIQPNVVAFSTFGASVSGARNKNYASLLVVGGTNQLATVEQTNLGAGLFADLGAGWMVTPNLSLGAVWTATLDYTRSSIERLGVEDKSSTLGFRFGSVGVRGNIYF